MRIQLTIFLAVMLTFTIAFLFGQHMEKELHRHEVKLIVPDTVKEFIFIWPDSSETLAIDDLQIKFANDSILK